HINNPHRETAARLSSQSLRFAGMRHAIRDLYGYCVESGYYRQTPVSARRGLNSRRAFFTMNGMVPVPGHAVAAVAGRELQAVALHS
ncbi:MAG TPA: hypothetical protein VLA21_07695, partial [Candidatus Limnocylindria bacterium]|nr:hypothetical protein [Candidatus Limnocylindria bacterium]